MADERSLYWLASVKIRYIYHCFEDEMGFFFSTTRMYVPINVYVDAATVVQSLTCKSHHSYQCLLLLFDCLALTNTVKLYFSIKSEFT